MPRVIITAIVLLIAFALLLFSGLSGSGSKNNSNSGAESETTVNALVKESPQESSVETSKIREISIEYVESEQKHFIVFDNGEKKQFQNKDDLDQILAEALSEFAEKVEFVSYDEDEYRDVVEAFLKTHNKR